MCILSPVQTHEEAVGPLLHSSPALTGWCWAGGAELCGRSCSSPSLYWRAWHMGSTQWTGVSRGSGARESHSLETTQVSSACGRCPLEKRGWAWERLRTQRPSAGGNLLPPGWASPVHCPARSGRSPILRIPTIPVRKNCHFTCSDTMFRAANPSCWDNNALLFSDVSVLKLHRTDVAVHLIPLAFN